MALLAIKVVPPVSACSTKIFVEGQLTGSTVRVLAGTTVVAEAEAKSASDLIDLLPGMVLQAGQALTATQTLDGDTSPPSPEPLPVQAPPPELGFLAVGELLSCSECVHVSGSLPGAVVRVTTAGASGQLRGESDLAAITGQVEISPPAGNDEQLRVTQVADACGLSGEAVPVGASSAPPGILPAPRIELPLKECQTVVRFNDVFPGATVTLERETGETSGCVAGTGGHWGVAPLQVGEQIRIRQAYPSCEIEGLVSDPLTVESAQPIPAPVFFGSFSNCAGTLAVILRNLIPSARIRLLMDGEVMGIGEVPPNATVMDIPVEGLPAGAPLTAQQGLCGVWGAPSDPMFVSDLSPPVPPPTVLEPLFPCAAAVRVETFFGNLRITVHSELLGAPIGQGVFANHGGGIADVPVAPLLLPGDTIRASIQGCGPQEILSEPVDVADNPPALTPPTIRSNPPLQVGMTWVPVEDVISGARVDVLVNGEWRGGSVIGGATGNVSILGALVLNDAVVARQRICARTSENSDVSFVQHRLPVAAFSASPQSGQAPLQVAFSNQSSNANHPTEPFRWMFGDGSATSTGMNPSHTFGSGGSFSVSLEATNASGVSDTASREIEVTPEPDPDPDPPDNDNSPEEPDEQEVIVTLEMQSSGVSGGPIAYLGYSGPILDSILVRIENPSNFFVSFIKGGHSNDDCGDPDAVVQVSPGGQIGPDEFEEIWGVSQPPGATPHPSGIGNVGRYYGACVGSASPSANPPQFVNVRAYFAPS